MSLQYPLSLRQYFAGQALVGLLGRPAVSWSELGKQSFEIADAMLKAEDDRLEDLRIAVDGALATGQSIDPRWLKKWLAKQEAP